MSGGKLVGRDGALVLCSAFFYIGSCMLVNPLITGYIESLGAGVALAGVVAAVMNICSLVFRPIAGNLADRLEKGGLACAGAALMCASSVGYALAAGPLMVGCLRVLNGIGYSMCSVCVSTWFAELVPPERVGAGMGVFGMMNALAMAVAPSIGLAAYGAFGYRAAMGVSGLLAGLAAFVMLLARRGRGVSAVAAAGAGPVAAGAGPAASGVQSTGDASAHATQAPKPAPFSIREAFALQALPAAVEVALFTTPYCAVQAYLVQYVATRSLDVTTALFFPVYAMALLALRALLRNAFDRCPFRLFALVSAVCEVGSLVLLAVMKSNALLLVAAVLMAGGYGVMCSVCQSTAVRLAGAGQTGRANATYYVGLDIGMMLGPALGGILMASVGAEWLFVAFTPLLVVAALVSLRVRSN